MNKKQHTIDKNEFDINYIKRKKRWLIATLIGILMVYISEPGSWLVLHQYDGYLVGIFTSCGVGILLSEIINAVNIKLDLKYSWSVKPKWRFCLQFIFGLLLPLIACFFFYWGYFKLYGYDLENTTYLIQVFTPLVLLIITCNSYYTLHFFVQAHTNKLAKEADLLLAEAQIMESIALAEELKQKDAKLSNQLLITILTAVVKAKLAAVKQAQQHLKLSEYDQIEDIALIISEDRNLYWYGKTAKKELWYNNLGLTSQFLPKQEFFRVSKSCMVARSNILAANYQSSKRVVLSLALPAEIEVNVSQRNTPAFILWYAMPIRAKKDKN